MIDNFSSLSDAELARMVRRNDPDAFVELSARYFHMIRAKAGDFQGTSAPEKEDLCQEGFLGLYMAATTYEEGKGASFSTYARVCVYRRMASAARKHASGRNRPLNESLSLEAADEFGMAVKDSPEALVELGEHFQSLQKKMETVLSPLERRVLALYVGGYRREEIPEKAGVSLKAFDNAMYRVRKKLKNF